MAIAQLCSRSVVTVPGDVPVLEAAQLMRDEGVGSLVVIDEENYPIGIVTDRDLAMEVLAEGRSPRIPMEEVMSEELITVEQDEGIAEVIEHMSEAGVRRVVVIDHEGKVFGVVSADDILQLLSNELASLGRLIRRQVLAAAA